MGMLEDFIHKMMKQMALNPDPNQITQIPYNDFSNDSNNTFQIFGNDNHCYDLPMPNHTIILITKFQVTVLGFCGKLQESISYEESKGIFVSIPASYYRPNKISLCHNSVSI